MIRDRFTARRFNTFWTKYPYAAISAWVSAANAVLDRGWSKDRRRFKTATTASSN